MNAEQVDFRAGPPYSEETRPVEISPEQKAFGLATNRTYETKFKRATPWHVQRNSQGTRILFYRPLRLKPGEEPPHIQTDSDIKQNGIIVEEVIDADDLAKESISKEVAEVLLIFKRVEDNLPDFIMNASTAFRSVKGMHRSYLQWGREEAEHSNAAELILLATGHKTQQELDDDYYKTQGKLWMPPFATEIENLIYPMFQEGSTEGNYNALAEKLKKEGALNCARVIRQVAADEAFHGAGYRAYIEEYAKLYPQEEVEAAALYVAWNFRMPALHLMRHRLRDTVRVVKTIGFNKEGVENHLRRGLRNLSFVDKDRAEEVVRGYWPAEKARLNEIMRKPASAVQVSELESPPTQIGNGLVPA